METYLPQRIKHTHLPRAKALLPMFEAVVNSFQAIEDRSAKKATIDVYVKRDPILDGGFDGRVDGFVITDNGIGFGDQNFDSFFMSDSPHKANRGAKGIGRFLWLKAFDCVNIESHFSNGNGMLTRAFEFTMLGEKPKGPAVPSRATSPS
jgi:hypothetical protein